LMERVRSGEFREDLFYRLYVVPIELPPLRQRGDDIVLIAQVLLQRHAKEEAKPFQNFSPEALDTLRAYPWPGNVRELVNVIRAVVAMHSATTVEKSMLSIGMRDLTPVIPWFAKTTPVEPPTTTTPKPSKNAIRPLADVEREAVDHALRAFDGNVSQAAKALHVNASTLYRKIQAWSAQGKTLSIQDVSS
jgi:two-component system, repressor protein LuxO